MKCLYITLIIISLNASQASIYSNLKQNVLSLFRRSSGDVKAPENKKISDDVMEHNRHPLRFYRNKETKVTIDPDFSNPKAKLRQNLRRYNEDIKYDPDLAPNQLPETLNSNQPGRKYFNIDTRRKSKKHTKYSETDDESSSLEMQNWMDDWDDEWMQKKFEALNSTQHRGDVVNMVAARPWGVPCGDPNQHDLPWGSCTLAAECEGEYRIWRGDFLCGRTPFVCCALQLTNYDMYQALDVSFVDSSMSSGSKEKKTGSKEGNRKRRKREKQRRRKEREKRKRQIKNNIRQIVKEIKKILNRSYRNGTAQRKRKTKELRKFIEDLKKAFKKDRLNVVNVHEYEMVKIDENLANRLDQIKDVNQAFMSNDTFRDIIINGTVNKATALRFLRTHPQVAKMFQRARSDYINKKKMKRSSRRSNTLNNDVERKKYDNYFLEYDVEYGNLYY